MPLVDEAGILKGLITIKDIEKVIEFPNSAKDKHGRLLAAAAVGITNDTFVRVEKLIEAGVDAIVIDTAHGHSAGVINKISEIRQTFKDVVIVAGNVATAEGARALLKLVLISSKLGLVLVPSVRHVLLQVLGFLKSQRFTIVQLLHANLVKQLSQTAALNTPVIS